MRHRIIHKPQMIVVQDHGKEIRLCEAKKWLISNYI